MSNHEFLACVVRKENGNPSAKIERLSRDELPPDDVLVRVQWSSLNYKDALAWQGHPGVVRKFPHVPGIDAAGIVVDSRSPQFAPGDEVFVTGFDFGAAHWGGWSEYARVPADWLLKRVDGLSPRNTMLLGTAGFTAAMCVDSLRAHGIAPEPGEIVVTGATGGVGILATKLLVHLGYQVTAVTGKPDQHQLLYRLGAARVLRREEVLDGSAKPLLSARWDGAVDTVGGAMLASVLKQLKPRGCATACGLVAGAELPLSLYPFLLRGVTLVGIDSAWCPAGKRQELWGLLATSWNFLEPPRTDNASDISEAITETPLAEIAGPVARILRGEMVGRTVVAVSPASTIVS